MIHIQEVKTSNTRDDAPSVSTLKMSNGLIFFKA